VHDDQDADRKGGAPSASALALRARPCAPSPHASVGPETASGVRPTHAATGLRDGSKFTWGGQPQFGAGRWSPTRKPEAPENPDRTGSWGTMEDNRFAEQARVDVAEAGKNGWRGKTHIHIEGQDGHLPPTTKIPGER
jgi:hypothetical protein